MGITKAVRVVWANQAKADLLDILKYIRHRDSSIKAKYVRDGIMSTADRIRMFPYKHPVEPVFNRPDVRFSVKWSYKIVFQIAGDTIRIVSIFHTAQHPAKLGEIDF